LTRRSSRAPSPAGHRRKSVELNFSVTSVDLDAPTGGVLQTAQSATYDERYVVEFQSGTWIVTENDL
jgi:hypothetical protein